MNLLIFNLKTDSDDAVLGFTTDWINFLAKHFEKISVLTMSSGCLALAPNVKVYSVGKENGFSEFRRAIHFYNLLFIILKSEKIDACFAHMMPLFVVMGWPFLKFKKIPIVLWYAHKAIPLNLKVATCLADRVVSASASSFRLNTSKLKILGHGIDTDRFLPRSGSKNSRMFQIITLGRISPAKNLDTLIHAMAILKKKHTKRFYLKIIGPCVLNKDALYLHKLEALRDQLKLQNEVEFIGAVPNHQTVSYYQSADCFINLSSTGSVDKAVLEAMSCGVPIITSNQAFMDVLTTSLRHWVLGKNEKIILANKIAELIYLPAASRRILKKQLRLIVLERHTLKNLVKNLVQEFMDLRGF